MRSSYHSPRPFLDRTFSLADGIVKRTHESIMFLDSNGTLREVSTVSRPIEPKQPCLGPTTEKITSPGKFQGEQSYLVVAYEAFLNGVADEHADGSLSIKVEPSDRECFPALKGRQRIRFVITDQGFVEEMRHAWRSGRSQTDSSAPH